MRRMFVLKDPAPTASAHPQTLLLLWPVLFCTPQMSGGVTGVLSELWTDRICAVYNFLFET